MTLDQYRPFVGPSTLRELRWLAEHLNGRRICCVNATKTGGGVAEILHRMIPLLRELGLDVWWEVLEGHPAFYQATKKLHNALHGKPETLTPEMQQTLIEVNQRNLSRLNLDADIVFIHDPQPIALVEARRQVGRHWLWRCHIDLTYAQRDAWEFLRPYVQRYDAAVYSAPAFARPLAIRQILIAPSIDPLSDKNKELSPETINDVFAHLGIPQDRPIVTQVSRFDYLKDPIGVVEAFRLVRRSIRCRLVLAGGPASDDPEGEEILAKVRERVGSDPDIHLLMLPPDSHTEINALQRGSTVIVQKSLREGFGLTVAEALWKGKPVVASAVGGIPLQVIHRHGGWLCHSIEGAALAIKRLLANPAYAQQLGVNGREHVRQNFLLTRHLKEYLLLFLALDHAEEVVELGQQ